MSKFHNLIVSEVRRETEDCVSLLLEPSEALKSTFNFQAGQYLTLRTIIDGEEVRRSYSICSAPQDGELRVAVKEVTDGKFSTFANRKLKAGDSIESMPPEGRFIVDSRDSTHHHLAFAAGSGITPVLSIIKDVLHSSLDARFTLFYVNKDTSSIIFKDALSELKDKYLERLQLFNLLTREPVEADLFGGRLDKDRCNRVINEVIDISTIDVAYLCGPESMIKDCKESLVAAGMSESDIKFELFTASVPTGDKSTQSSNDEPKGEKIEVQVVLDGITTTVRFKQGSKTILDAALDAGLDVPFSCQGGVCCTCRAKMTSGKVRMDINYALEPDEVEKGYVLSCQSHPVGDGPFVIDYDQP